MLLILCFSFIAYSFDRIRKIDDKQVAQIEVEGVKIRLRDDFQANDLTVKYLGYEMWVSGFAQGQITYHDLKFIIYDGDVPIETRTVTVHCGLVYYDTFWGTTFGFYMPCYTEQSYDSQTMMIYVLEIDDVREWVNK